MQPPSLTIQQKTVSQSASATGQISDGPATVPSLSIQKVSYHPRKAEAAGGLPERMDFVASSAAPQEQGLIPPLGARFGTAELTAGGNIAIPFSDKTKNPPHQRQIASVSLNNKLYVYNANAKGRNDYYVILVQTGAFSPGQMALDSKNQKGFEQDEVLLTSQIARPGGGAFSSEDVTLLSSSPQDTSGAKTVDTIASVTMELLVSSGGNEQAPQIFKAQVDPGSDAAAANSLIGWAVNSTGAPGALSSGWDYYQTDVWNPHTDRPSDFKTWWHTMYKKDGTVVDLPELSKSTLHLLTVTAWKFDQALVVNNSLGVDFTGDVGINYASFVNSDGSTDGHHRIHYPEAGFKWSFPLDLVAVVDPQPVSYWIGLAPNNSEPYLLGRLSSGSWRPAELLKSSTGTYPPALSSMAFRPGLQGVPEMVGISTEHEPYLFQRLPSGDWTFRKLESLLNPEERQAFAGVASGFSQVVKQSTPNGAENVVVFLSDGGKLYAVSQTRAAELWHFHDGAIPSAAALTSIALGVGNLDYLQLVGADAAGDLYLSWRDGSGNWNSAGKLSEIAAGSGMDIPFSAVAMAQGNHGNLQLIALAKKDHLPRLFWQDGSNGHWNYAGAFEQFAAGDGMKVPLSQIQVGVGNDGNLQLVGLGLNDGFPYLYWQDNATGKWNYAGNLYEAAKFEGEKVLFSSLALGAVSEADGRSQQLVGLGYMDSVASYFEQDPATGHWSYVGPVYPPTSTQRAFSQIVGLDG